jgi:transposase
MAASPALPEDLAAAHEMIARLNTALAQKDEAIAQQEHIIAKSQETIAQRDIEVARLVTILRRLQRRQFGQKSEKLDPEQMALGLEDIEAAIGEAEAHQEAQDATLKTSRSTNRGVKRGQLPAHLPRIEQIVDIEDRSCPCCAKPLHVIGEDVSERLDVVPSQYRVLVTRRPKYACRACTDGVVQAPAPPRLVEGGLPTEALIAHLLVGKYADHLPLYRQHQILKRAGIDIDRPCLADWVGRATFALRPIAARMLEHMRRSGKLFCDETTAPVLDPGRGKTKKGYLWAVARDDRPWNGPEPPGVVYLYAPGRGGEHAARALEGFKGVLQVDGYGGYNALADAKRRDDPLMLAFCWAHWRREFFDLAKGGNAPIADEALKRIAALYEIEARIRGQSADARCVARQREAAPLVEDLFGWLKERLERIMQGSELAGVIRYGLKRREGLTRFLEDGRIEIDNNTVERGMRGIALNRKNALFAGSDEGGAAWGVIASLIETCKLNGVEPNAYLTKTLTRIVRGWPANRLDELLPWADVA